MRSVLRQSYEEAQKLAKPRIFLMAPGETLPELAHIQLLAVDGDVEVPVQLSDRAGTWRCQAYFFRGYDYVAITRDIEAMG